MKLSILIPAYNEEDTILKILKKVEAVKLPVKKEIIIVDDGSTDSTGKKLEKVKHKVIRHKTNRGKGAAIRTGIKYSTGDIIIIQDADLEYNPKDYKKLIEPILEGRAKVVYGSRFKTGAKGAETKWSIPVHFIGNKILSFLTAVLYFQSITDIETCYKCFRKDVLRGMEVKSKGFEFEPEITSKILKKGYRILEVPIDYKPRKFREGKKINWRDGIKAAYFLLKYRITD